MQALAATAVGNLGCSGDEDFKSSFRNAGGLDKLTEIVHLLHAPAALRKAASRALADITTGQSTCPAPALAFVLPFASKCRPITDPIQSSRIVCHACSSERQHAWYITMLGCRSYAFLFA